MYTRTILHRRAIPPYVLLRQTTGLIFPRIWYTDPYMKIRGGLVGGVANMAYPAAQNLHWAPNGMLPSRRTVSGNCILPYQPSLADFDSVALPNAGGGVQQYLVQNFLRLNVSFDLRRLSLRVSGRDWLARPANNHLTQRLAAYQRLGPGPQFQGRLYDFRINFAAFNVLVLQGFDAKTIQGIQLMDDMFQALNHLEHDRI
jgi:hypothetical protein